MMICNRSKKLPGWSDMDELKYLICCINKYKCSRVRKPPSCSIILPPRIEVFSCKVPRRPPCVPPPRCCPMTPGPCCPMTPGPCSPITPCCLDLLPPAPPPVRFRTPRPERHPKPCCYYSPLPCNPYN